LIDEVLAVGDANFQQKCFEHLHRLRARGCTILLVTHDMPAVMQFCERVVWLDHGRLVADGASDQVARSYLDAVAAGATVEGGPDGAEGDGSRQFTITSVRFQDSEGRQVRQTESGKRLQLVIGYRAATQLKGLQVGVTIFRNDGVRCVDARLDDASVPSGEGSLVLAFPAFNL